MDFPTKAACKRHFNRVHPGHKNSELGSSLLPLPSECQHIDVKQIVSQAGSNPMFACQLHDGSYVWRHIDLDAPIAKEFLQTMKPSCGLPLADMKNWAQGFVLVH